MNNAIDILLVEDRAEDAELAVRALKKAGLANNLYQVTDGAEALDFLFAQGAYAGRALNNRPKLVLLDLKLPKLSGLEVLESLRKFPPTATLPVVVMTSSREDQDLDEAYRLGANSYVVKPLDFEQFARAIQHLGLYWVVINEVPTR